MSVFRLAPDLLSGPFGQDKALLRDIFAASGGTLILVNRNGHVLLGDGDIHGALQEPALSQLRAALRDGLPWCTDTEFGPPSMTRPVRVSLAPLAGGLGLLSVIDRSREQSLQDQLLQAQRMQAVGQLAGGIAHDFNNLLTAILGAVDDLAVQPGVAPVGTADLAQIRESATRGADLVRQLMAFGRQQTLQPRVIAINEAIRRATALLQRLLPDDIELVLALEEPGRNVRIDPTQFDQILINLAVNAGHAMPGGGVLTITSGHAILLRPTDVGAETIPPGRYVTIEVRDTGIGIDAASLPHIFEPFFTTRRAEGGTGLGLSTVHGIVRQSGGYLTVQSALTHGTCFRIFLPRDESAVQEVAMPMVLPVSGLARTGPVLLVEDESAVRRLAERALIRAGWTVVAASSGQEAMLRAPRDLACVVSDVVMPGMDGPSLVRALRRDQPGLPAILMSGYADAAQREAMAESDIRFLAKPFAMLDLVEAVGQTR
jgi:two-component system cell cycle sensor histidine kinase/response regulator CckA